jgi:IstB-like ATP binding protein
MKRIELAAPAETVPAICETCGKEFDRPVFRLKSGEEILRVRECPKCNAPREQRALAIENQERQRAIAKPLLGIVPARYRNFDRARLPIVHETIDQILSWRPISPSQDRCNPALICPPGERLPMTDETIDRIRNSRSSPSADGRGLTLVGPPHIGKRRLIYALGADLFFTGFQIAQISAADFESLGPLRSDREVGTVVRRRLTQLRSAQILIFTDVGAEKLTESSQREFYGLVEHRAQHLLPILWSTQFSKEQITSRFITANAPEIALARGRAAVDRLNEISDVIAVERKSFSLPEREAEGSSACA